MASAKADRIVRIGIVLLLGAIGVSTVFPLFLLIPFALIAVPVGLAYRVTAQWKAWEFLNPLGALLSWGAAVSAFGLQKSMANLIEFAILGALCGGSLWVRAVDPFRARIETRRGVALLFALVIGAVVALLVPSLPE